MCFKFISKFLNPFRSTNRFTINKPNSNIVDIETFFSQNEAGEPSKDQALKDYYDIHVNTTQIDLMDMEPDLYELRIRTLGPHLKHIQTAKTICFVRIAVAAAVLIVISLSAMFMLSDKRSTNVFVNLIAPGTDQAVLTLADGTKINLATADNGLLSDHGGIEVTKVNDGTLSYKVKGSKFKASGYHTITTPRGGKYKVILSDGTKVWLNAGSSLSYLASLNKGGVARKVKMNGEAYFEVKKDAAHPFMVSTDLQDLEVLGTHFNVSAYTEDSVVKTTLVEGSVRISAISPNDEGGLSHRSGVILKPNQQATLFQNNIEVAEVDTEDAVGWKNGDFVFQDESLGSIMPEISRWYDVSVVYQDKDLANKVFGAVISRSKTLSEVLSALEKTGNVHFKIEGRTVTVMK